MSEENESKQATQATSELNAGLGELTQDEIWWLRERRSQKKKKGAYWLSKEGRSKIRETWTDPEGDGCPILPLLNALEAWENDA